MRIDLIDDHSGETPFLVWDQRARTGVHLLSPFDGPDVIERQPSVAVELIEALDKPLDDLVMPAGGGGLSDGVIGYLDALAAATFETLFADKKATGLSHRNLSSDDRFTQFLI